MFNFNGDFNDISVIDYLVVYIIIAIIGNFLQQSFRNLFSDQKTKRKQNELINAFKNSKSISPYIQKYDKIKYLKRDDYSIVALNVGLFLGFLVSPSLLYSMNWYIENIAKIDLDELLALKMFISTILFTYLLPTSGMLIMQNKIDKSFNGKTILNKAIGFANMFTFFGCYTVLTYPLNVFSLIIILYNWNSIPDKAIFWQIAFAVSIALMFLTPIIYTGSSRSFKRELKSYINDRYGEKYPYIKIVTDENNEIQGHVVDIFDDKVIKLLHENSEKIVLWDSVHSLEINNNLTTYHNEKTQKYLYEYV